MSDWRRAKADFRNGVCMPLENKMLIGAIRENGGQGGGLTNPAE
jgi:hypothetical protein